MGVRHNREKGNVTCVCGSCGSTVGPYASEEEMRNNMKNWGYAFIDDFGDTRCPGCIQAAFDDQQVLKAMS